MPRLLIVGAGGFIGGFIAAEALRRGYDTWVTVRETTSRRYLQDPRLTTLVLDYDDPEQMGSVLSTALPAGETWDAIVYNLGATKCSNFADFNKINYLYLRTFLDVLRSTGLMPGRFIYMSSLSALGVGDEKGYTPFTGREIPDPNTRYGLSKIKAETLLDTSPDVPWTVLRPTGVYGPHEQDYLMMIKCIDRHLDFGVGYRRQMLTFIYVDDLARAIFDALESPNTLKKKYILSEPRAYTQSEFRKIVAEALGRKAVVPLRLPLWAAYVACVVAEKYGVAKMQATTLNSDKYKIMKQRNWACDVSAAKADFGFAPQVDLREGIRRTVEAYREAQASEQAAKREAKKASKKGGQG
ncbi:MAG: NAD(P)-dependent oxidoreductase [Bacteroidales bacterium]|nr:NAD(P)-dependent oxidoreductase [Bacteroidales bacterium]